MKQIDKLFRVTSERQITVRGVTRTVYLRTISGVEESARNDYAVSQSRAKLRALRQQGSPEWNQYMNMDGFSNEELIERAMNLKRPAFVRAALLNVHRTVDPEPPDHPTITEVAEAEEEMERLDGEVENERASYVSDLAKEYRERIVGLDVIALANEVRDLLTDALLSSAYNQASNCYTLFAACYEDDKYRRRYFTSAEEVAEADNAMIQELLAEYAEIDAFSQRPEELKN